MNKIVHKKRDKGILYILPWIIGFSAFTLIPFFALFVFSFCKYDLLSAPRFIGLRNYKNIFLYDPKFWLSLRVTFKYAIVAVPCKLIVALLIAMAFSTKHKLIGLYRTVFYIPSIIGGGIAVAVTWSKLFSREGAINSLVYLMTGIKPNISWVADQRTALFCLIALCVWQFGSPMLIFLAGLKDIPRSYYEAAHIDGANSLQTFFKITIPLLTPVIFFNLVMQIINGFMTFTQGLVITNGGPVNSTLFYQLYVYRTGFEQFSMGYAAALSVILLIIIASLTSLVFKSSSSWVYYASEKD